jgi:hypothetical protein
MSEQKTTRRKRQFDRRFDGQRFAGMPWRKRERNGHYAFRRNRARPPHWRGDQQEVNATLGPFAIPRILPPSGSFFLSGRVESAA